MTREKQNDDRHFVAVNTYEGDGDTRRLVTRWQEQDRVGNPVGDPVDKIKGVDMTDEKLKPESERYTVEVDGERSTASAGTANAAHSAAAELPKSEVEQLTGAQAKALQDVTQPEQGKVVADAAADEDNVKTARTRRSK